MARTKVVVNLADGTQYDVRIGCGLLEGLGSSLRAINDSGRALIITDSQVAPLYLEQVKASLVASSYRVSEITLPAGESSKSPACITEIWEAMAALALSRDALVLALGGGVVGDIAGFAASTYMRGIEVVQLPTSLLAMVDSSVGGKTGINLEAGKNLIGAFKQPLYVCASVDTLSTLDEREWICGCGEIAKSAVIDSDDFFFWLSEHSEKLAARDELVVIEAIARSVIFKANVVAQDVQESKGIRECLNYGHTLGHAIETLAGYGRFSHGQAVAEGMRFAARLAAALVGTSVDFIAAQDELLDSLGLTELDCVLDAKQVVDTMMKDKKVRSGKIRFVLPRDVGDWEVREVEKATVLEHLQAWERSKETD